VSWAAVLAATVAYYLLGGLWFTPLFGRLWDRAVGVARVRGARAPALSYVAPLVGCFLTSLATSLVVSAFEVTQLGDALLLGVVLGVGCGAAVSLTNSPTPTAPHPLLFAAVTGGYHAVGITLATAIVCALG
jgi:uncharacterized membrane protein